MSLRRQRVPLLDGQTDAVLLIHFRRTAQPAGSADSRSICGNDGWKMWRSGRICGIYRHAGPIQTL